MDKADRVHALSDFLEEEGYRPRTDDDGDIVFKVEGRTYFVMFDDNDDEFYRIVLPAFWEIESPEEGLKVQQAALKVTAIVKAAKVFVSHEDTWASAEVFSSSIDNFKSVFFRCLRSLQLAVAEFVDEMKA